MEVKTYFGSAGEVAEALGILGSEVAAAYRQALEEARGGLGGKVLANLIHLKEATFLQVVWMPEEGAPTSRVVEVA